MAYFEIEFLKKRNDQAKGIFLSCLLVFKSIFLKNQLEVFLINIVYQVCLIRIILTPNSTNKANELLYKQCVFERTSRK